MLALRRTIAFIAMTSALYLPRAASADEKPTLSGSWSASALSESWSTESWGDACGPKPVPQGAPSGGVSISEQGGELAISGAGRNFVTNQCWEQMPGLARSSHSASPRGWSTRCSTPAGDPRRATVVTSINATDETIVLGETGNYEFIIEGTTCRAAVRRSRSFKLIERAGAKPTASAAPSVAPPVKTAEPKPKPLSACTELGNPARLEVRPARKLARPGESFTLSAIVRDENGCALGGKVKFTVQDAELAESVSIDDAGKVTIADDASGSSKVSVEFGNRRVEMELEVAPADRFDALLRERGLNAEGEDERVVVAEIASGLGGAETRAEDRARERRQLFMVIVGAVASALALVGLVLFRRGAKTREAAKDRESAPVPAPNVTLFEGAARPMECPTCNKLYPPESAFCALDGAALAPAGTADVPVLSSIRPSAATKPKDHICPSCGERFSGEATFCGKDGTQLVPIN